MMNKRISIIIVILVFTLILIAWQSQKESKIPKVASPKLRKLSQVKVAVLYKNITDGPPVGIERSPEEIIKILKETKADLIFRGFWRWGPAPESPDNIPPELVEVFAKRMKIKPKQVPLLVKKSGYNYKELEKRISAIKKEIPNIIFVGAIPAQRINRIDKNDITGKVYTTDETWAMALDPQKWKIERNGKPITKENFQARFSRWHGWTKQGETYDPRKVEAYFPDITNPKFQEILLSWAKRQIDAGVDAIWIDGLPQTIIFYILTNDVNHPAIKDLFEASKKIIDEIHKYGELKGKRIYVGAWAIPIKLVEGLPELPSNIDFVTMTPSEDEIFNKRLDMEKWNKRISKSKELYGNTPIFAFIDWDTDPSPMRVFSQELSIEEQRDVLKILDESFAKMGINFVYPVHGGHMGKSAKRLAFGKYRNYDALAPEFDTYETIKKLARNKK